MALTNDQKTSFVFKKAVSGASETDTGRDFFEEPYPGRDIVLPSQVWNEASSIPNTAPSSLTDGGTSGVVTRYISRSMSAVGGAPKAFYLDLLVDSIPFNFGDGVSYNYTITTSTGTSIPFGVGDWVVNNSSGTLYFYGSLPSGVSDLSPPKISFYRYTGTKGVGSGSGGGGGGITVQDEGTDLTTTATTLNFTGSAVVASGTGATKTINITGNGPQGADGADGPQGAQGPTGSGSQGAEGASIQGAQGAQGPSTYSITISTSSPSGGSNGDLWIKYT